MLLVRNDYLDNDIISYSIIYDGKIVWFNYIDISTLITCSSINNKFLVKIRYLDNDNIYISEYNLYGFLVISRNPQAQIFLNQYKNIIKLDIMHKYIIYNNISLQNYLTNNIGYISIFHHVKNMHIVKLVTTGYICKYIKHYIYMYCFYCKDIINFKNIFYDYFKKYKIINNVFFIKNINNIGYIIKFIISDMNDDFYFDSKNYLII